MPNLRVTNPKNSIKYGDIFRIGNHLLACGDARDIKLVDRLIGQSKVKCLIVDVPYGIKAVESKVNFSKLKVNKNILNDDIVSEPEYVQFTKDWLKPIIPHLAAKNSSYIFNSDKMIFALRQGMEEAGLKFAQLLIWIKGHAVIGRRDYLPAHELIAYGWHGTHDFKKAQDRSLLFYPKPNKNPLHPTQKPVGLLRRLILNSTDVGDVVYDSFAGSGSLGIAAEQTKRISILIEREEEYCLTIIDRFKKLTNLKAVKL